LLSLLRCDTRVHNGTRPRACGLTTNTHSAALQFENNARALARVNHDQLQRSRCSTRAVYECACACLLAYFDRSLLTRPSCFSRGGEFCLKLLAARSNRARSSSSSSCCCEQARTRVRGNALCVRTGTRGIHARCAVYAVCSSALLNCVSARERRC